MNGDRIPLPRVWVSPSSREGWDTFCETYGVTRTAVIEAIGLVMIDMVAGKLPVTRATVAVVERARHIDKQRRARS
jgi:hypothetical protein